MNAVFIAQPTPDDCRSFLEAVARSKSLHGDWVSPPATPAAFDEYLLRATRDDFCSFFIRLNVGGAIVGVVNVSNIVLEPLCSAFLGFYALEPHSNQGLMKQGLRLVLQFAFGELGLHRVEANIQPANMASRALVQSLGFRQEGFSPKYLHIAGEWRDHERWALLAEEFRPIFSS